MEFVPANDLEKSLLACQDDAAQWPAFVSALLNSQIFILIDGEPSPDAETEPKPLVLESPSGFDALLLFTTPGRATPFAQRFPQFAHGLLVDCRWLLSRIGPGLGLAINPGWEVGLEMAPHGFAKFRKDFQLGAE